MSTAILSLHEIGEAQDILDSLIVEHDGEATPEIEALWEQLSGQRDEKIERWGLWLRGAALQAELIKAEEERLSARRKALEAAVKRGKDALQFHMERLSCDKVKGKLITVAIQKNNPSVHVLNEHETDGKPARFMRFIPAKYEWDKKAMLDAWKEDPSSLNGVAVVEQSRSLRIR